MNIQWKAEEYAQNFDFVPQYGESVLNLLEIKPGMIVLDLGCGGGRLTKEIAERGASVIGMDDSADMLRVAEAAYPELRFVQGNASQFSLEEPVDAVFSNAVLHWIDAEHQDEMFACISNALKPGGQLVFEMGEKGCAETVHLALEKTFASHGYSYRRSQYFPTIGEYAPILERHGLCVEYAVLFDRDTRVEGEDGVGDWIRMFIRKPFEWEHIPAEEAEAIIRETVELVRPVLLRDDGWHVDYVRLRMTARKKRAL